MKIRIYFSIALLLGIFIGFWANETWNTRKQMAEANKYWMNKEGNTLELLVARARLTAISPADPRARVILAMSLEEVDDYPLAITELLIAEDLVSSNAMRKKYKWSKESDAWLMLRLAEDNAHLSRTAEAIEAFGKAKQADQQYVNEQLENYPALNSLLRK